MLTLYSVSTPRDQSELFKRFDPAVGTWLVSDLKSKLDLNRHLLREREFLPGESVLRASELWKILITRVRPDLQVISREFATALIGQKLEASDLDWARAPGAAQAAVDYMTQFMPILAHPEGEAMMREWQEENPTSVARWGRWFDLSLKLWSEFLDDGFVVAAWASGVVVNELANLPSLGEIWSRPLFVDLGPELDQVEADLLVQLSQAVDIHVVRPAPTWGSEYPKTLVAYEIFERKLKVGHENIAAPPSTAAGSRTYLKFTTMIAEVKGAVGIAREWLAAGALPKDIAIVAPDLEAYWPALASYLDEEGISTQKDRVRRLHGYPDIARFMANLRLRTGEFGEADVELALFDVAGASERIISFDRFKTLYGTLYSREDMQRHEVISERFKVEISPGTEIPRDDFVAWSLRQLPAEAELLRVESLYKRLFAEVPQSTRLDSRRWLAYIEQLASRVECRIKDGDPDGIACINLSSADNSPAKRLIVLGLTEGALRQGGGTGVLFSDIWSLGQEFGFHLASEDQARLEFEAKWALDNTDREVVLCAPETDFNGAAQTPSWLWVRGAREAGVSDTLTVPEPTRWDELQRAGWDEIGRARLWSAAQRAYLEQTFHEDLGEKPYESFGEGLVETLSPSGIEDYLNCPFIFAAKRLMGLSDVAELDLEVDASRRGSLMHKVFELLTIEPMRFDLDDEELGKSVEHAREQSRLELADVRLWPPLKARQVDLARRFLAFEKNLRSQFAGSKVLGREVDIAGFIRPATGELIPQPEPGAFKFVGRIDRVDTDANENLAIYDYKSSAATATQFGSWCKNNKIQLLLYAIAVENGLTEFSPRPVQSAMYYVARPLNRDYGYKVDGVEQGLYDTSDRRKRNRVTSQEKQELFAQGRAMVKRAIDGINAGRFDPSPRDKNDCPDCLWSAVCRAPHLNS